MKIVLARPPRRDLWDTGLCVPPLGLAYIAASLQHQGYQVRIIDAYAERLSWRAFEDEVRALQPDVLGLTIMTPMLDVAQKAFSLLRPHVRFLIAGGPHPTAVKKSIFKDIPELDAAVVGEGEDAIVDLVRWFQDGRNGPAPLGVCAPDNEFKARNAPNIHTIHRPARSLLPNAQYQYLFSTQPGFGTIISSRGCPFRCSFCDKSVSGSRWRARTADDVVDEMREMVHRYDIGFINFYDDNFTLNQARVAEICESILRMGLKVDWKCEGRVDNADFELLKLMRRAGCRTVAYGVESANPKTLALLRKDIQVEQTVKAFELTRKAGLRSLAYMILGAPGESVENVQSSIQFCRDIKADYVQFSSLTLMPGTPLAAQYTVNRSVKNPFDSDVQRPTLTDLSDTELQALMRKAWLGFYMRPRAIGRLTRDAFRSGALPEGIRIAVNMGKWALSSALPSEF
ncbi:MAG: radical SAM protein [Myxococcota bacterium]|nr:radical SAM protein [Myxococcota bacterium]